MSRYEVLTILVAGASLIVSALAFGQSRSANKLAKRHLQAEEDSANKTDVRVSLREHRTAQHTMVLEFSNIGRSPAHDVDIEVLDEIADVHNPLKSAADGFPIPVIAPGASSNVRMPALLNCQWRFTARITWRNADGSLGECKQHVTPG